MTSIVSSIVLPLFGILVVGFFVGHFQIMSKDGSKILGRFVFVIALPALVFISLARVPVSEFFHWQFIGALGGGMLGTLVLSLVVSRVIFRESLTATGLHGVTAMFSSTGYIGLPLILITFGESALVPGIVGAVITGAIFLPVGIIFAEIDRGRSQGKISLSALVGVTRNPLLFATTAGLFASGIGVNIPAPLATLCELLGDAYIPCALFAAGLFMSGGLAKADRAEITWLVFAKLFLHPLITWWLAYHVFSLEGALPAVAVLQAALPTGVPVFVLAQQYNTFVVRSNAVIVISTCLSVFTLSGLLILLG